MSPALWILVKALACVYAAGFLYVLSRTTWKPCTASCVNCRGDGCLKYALRVAALWPAILAFAILKWRAARGYEDDPTGGEK